MSFQAAPSMGAALYRFRIMRKLRRDRLRRGKLPSGEEYFINVDVIDPIGGAVITCNIFGVGLKRVRRSGTSVKECWQETYREKRGQFHDRAHWLVCVDRAGFRHLGLGAKIKSHAQVNTPDWSRASFWEIGTPKQKVIHEWARYEEQVPGIAKAFRRRFPMEGS